MSSNEEWRTTSNRGSHTAVTKLADATSRTRRRRAATATTGGTDRNAQVWERPTFGTVKINTGASWMKATEKGSTGVIARDWEGRIVVGRNSTSTNTSAKNLKAKEILQAVQFAVQHEWNEVVIESDEQQMINMLQGTQIQLVWELKNVLMDINDLVMRIPRVQWNFVRRSANRCANWIARMARQEMCPNNWTLIHPPSLFSLCLLDNMHLTTE